jgi:sterol desaturase/sphingolipid hydroxylase (fatty acid hydroxylase superfamily)
VFTGTIVASPAAQGPAGSGHAGGARQWRMTSAQVIVLATPVFLGLIAFELAVGVARGRNTYRLADALSSIGLGAMSQVVGVFTRLFTVGLYTLAFEHVSLWQLPADSLWVWLFALLGYDFCYYWLHRAGHRVAVLWAAHVVHHQSEDYNLSTALRQTSSGFLLGWVFYLPLAVIGVPPLVFGTVALIDLLYQFWVHTEHIGKLGGFDRWLCSPSNHRVHHAVNDRYLDRNYGGILIVWDRLFGTFAEEDDGEPCVYGTRAPLHSWNPLLANLQVYRDLLRDSWHTRRWADKWRVWLTPPGWRPADVAARWPKPPFEMRRVRRFDPQITEQAAWVAGTLFAVILLLTTVFLWNAHRLPGWLGAALAALIVALLWLVGFVTNPADDEPDIAPDTVPEAGRAQQVP